MQAAPPLPDASTQILAMFESVRPQWVAAVSGHAIALFWALAGCAFAWGLIRLAIDAYRNTSVEVLAWITRYIIVTGVFFAILLGGQQLMDSIFKGFQALGQQGSGMPALSAGDMFFRGINVGGTIMDSASIGGFFENPAATLALINCGLLVAISLMLVSAAYFMTLVEAYAALSVGLFFLAFGGWSVTRPYVERYFSLTIAIGIKVLLTYFLVGTAYSFTDGLLVLAANLANDPRPLTTALFISGMGFTFLLICWFIPKWFAGMIAGAPAMSAGDAIGTGAAMIGGAVGGAYLAKTLITSTIAAMAAKGAGGAAKTTASAAPGFMNGGSSTPTHVPPPSSNGHGRNGASPATTAAAARGAVPHDGGGGPPNTPHMNMRGDDE